MKVIKPGPGALVTAAFIGPGTITTCTIAGARFGTALLWSLVFSVIATIVLQEMTVRLGVIGRMGLGEALRNQFTKPLSRLISVSLVISAIVIGNAAFETGNLLGASLGLSSMGIENILGSKLLIILIGILAFAILFHGNYKIIEKSLVSLVIVMSLMFVGTAIIVFPDPLQLLKGLFIPNVPDKSWLTIVGLIGTTVVPYNLFLHASAVQQKWKTPDKLKEARTDLSYAVILGGIISMAIVVSAASAYLNKDTIPENGSDLAFQLKPLLGEKANIIIGIGLFAAGISSAITAPLAAAWAAAGIMGWKNDLKSLKFRMTWEFILLSGMTFSLLGFKPIEAILFAQAANGILLPIIAIYLLIIMNNAKLLGNHTNTLKSNVLGIGVAGIAVFLGLRSLLSVFGII